MLKYLLAFKNTLADGYCDNGYNIKGEKCLLYLTDKSDKIR